MPSADSFHALVRGDRRGPLAWLARAGLWCASVPYGLGVGLRNRRFDRNPALAARVPVPVVCVGNLTLGGTGKTVCVEAVARFYRTMDLAVAVLSRGYGAAAGGRNDEALVLEDNLPDVPHLQGADRTALAHAAVEELEAEVLVLDDGFQHRRLHRDLDVVLLDATRPLSTEHVFPLGYLREPVGGLKRAGLAVLTRCDQVSPESLTSQRRWIAERFPQLPVATTTHRPVELIGGTEGAGPVGDLSGRTVAGFCGIGNPEAFRRTLTDLGAEVVAFKAYPDHYAYRREDVNGLQLWAEKLPPETMAVTTQKDWVKLRIGDLGGRPLRAVRVGLAFLDGEDVFHDKLRAAVVPRGSGTSR